MCSRNAKANFKKKSSVKLEYFIRIEVEALFVTNVAIYALQKRWILLFWSLLRQLRYVIYIIKILYFRLRVTAANSVFFLKLTHLIINFFFLIV